MAAKPSHLLYPSMENFEGVIVFIADEKTHRFIYMYWFGEIDDIDRTVENEYIHKKIRSIKRQKHSHRTVTWTIQCTPIVEMLCKCENESYPVEAIRHELRFLYPFIFVRQNDNLELYDPTMAERKNAVRMCRKLYSFADHVDELREMARNRNSPPPYTGIALSK